MKYLARGVKFFKQITNNKRGDICLMRTGKISFLEGIVQKIKIGIMMGLCVGIMILTAGDLNAADNLNREITMVDVPDATLLQKLQVLADSNSDGKLTLGELNDYPGNASGVLDLSNSNVTNLQGLGYAKSVREINLSGLNITLIPRGNFKDCTKLEKITLPQSVQEIETSAFEGCSSLKTIEFTESLRIIGEKAFNNCTILNNVILPNNLSVLGKSAFAATGLTAITIPNEKVVLGESVFSGCKALKDVNLPEGIITIPIGFFRGAGIEQIRIPTTVKVIDNEAFMETYLYNIDLRQCKNLVTLGESAFSLSTIKGIQLPESLTEIKDRAFEGCTSLTQITLPSQITTINPLTFSQNVSLEHINFTPVTVNGKKTYKLKEIKEKAFQHCYVLGGETGVVDCFKDLDQLISIGEYSFAHTGYGVKIGNTYQKDEWGQIIYEGIKEVVLPPNLKEIGAFAFINSSTLISINIPHGVTAIKNNTFQNCYNLQNVELSNSLTDIGDYAFDACKSLNDVFFAPSLKTVGDYAFRGCALEKYRTENGERIYVYLGLQNVSFPDHVEKIGKGAFQNCYNLKSVVLPKNLEVISDSTFQGCSIQLKDKNGKLDPGMYQGLSQLTLPDNFKTIGNYAFQNCYTLELESKNIGSTVTSIGNNAFENCYSIVEIKVPASLLTISNYTFSGCGALRSLDLTHATELTSIGVAAFKNTNISGVLRWPPKVDVAQNYVFEGNSGLTGVVFPDIMKTINVGSFKDCTGITTITAPASVSLVTKGVSSFINNRDLSSAVINAVPKDIEVYENNSLTLPINIFTEISKVQMGNEDIATGIIQADKTGKPIVTINGVKEGTTKAIITGVIEYQVGKNASTGAISVNRITSSVTFNLNVTAKKCIALSFPETIKGVKLSTTPIQLTPNMEPVDTTDLKEWSSDNEFVATVDQNGKLTALQYGTATITLKVGSKIATCTINVCAPATNMTLDKTTANIILGDSLTLTPTLTYAAGYASIKETYPETVVWSSSNEEIATVDQKGNITSKNYGEATITAKASAGNIIRTCKITVIPATTTIAFDQTEITLKKGESKVVTMTLAPENTPISSIKLTVSPNYIVAISQADKAITVTASRTGTATITATPITGNPVSFKVNAVSPLSTLTVQPMEVNKGASKTITLSKDPLDATDVLRYTSLNTDIAIVDQNGKVTGMANGVAKVRVETEDGRVSAICTVTVKVPLTGIQISQTTAKVLEQRTLQIQVTFNPSDATNKEVAWESSDEAVATVDKNGVVTGVKTGTARITVKAVDASNGIKSATCIVTVEPNNYLLTDQFVNRFYEQCMGRPGDQGGIDFWSMSLVNRQVTAAHMAEFFVFGEEFIARGVSDSEFINIMYSVFFDRSPDSAGEQYWLDRLSYGATRKNVFSLFVNTPEFNQICEQYNIIRGDITLSEAIDLYPDRVAFVKKFYAICMGREADEDGLAYWVDAISYGQFTGTTFAQYFVNSEEFSNKNLSNEDYLTVMYEMFFARTPDEGGWGYWLQQLIEGRSRNEVLAGFIYSAEFMQICDDHDVVFQ